MEKVLESPPPSPSSITTNEETVREYAIVLFLNEDKAPGIVLSSWIYDVNLCYYPNVKTNEARDSLLRKKIEADNSWSRDNLIKVLHFYDSFDEAISYLKKAEETSNLSSDEEENDRVRRKRITKKYIFPGEEDSENEHIVRRTKMPQMKDNPYPLPINPNGHSFLRKSSCTDKSQELSVSQVKHASLLENEVPSRPSSAQSFTTSHIASQHSEIFKNRPSVECGLPPKDNYNSSCTGCIKQNSVSNELLKETLTNICSVLQRLELKIDNLQGARLAEDLNEEDLGLFTNLPVKNMEQFQDIEKKLEDNKSFHQIFFKRIASVGGRSCRGLIQNIMKTVLTDSVGEMYSLTGKGKENEKKSFASTHMFKIITLVSKKMYNKETDATIRAAVSDWLNQAKVRRTRREQHRLGTTN